MPQILLSIWTKLSQLGAYRATTNEFLQRKVVLSNQLGVLGGFVGGMAILITNLNSTIGTAPPTAFAILYIACIPLFNWLGWINFSRVSLVMVVPMSFLAGTVYLKMTVPHAYSIVYYVLPRFAIIASLILAATVLDIRKPWETFIGLLSNGLCLILFDPVHRWFGFGIESASLELHNYNTITIVSMAAFIFLAVGYLFLQNINIQVEKRIVKLYDEMKVSNEELVLSEEEIKQNSEELSSINEALVLQNDTITKQSQQLTQKNKALLDSMTYARRIQKGFVSKKHQLDRVFPDNFVLDIPRDIVSGDYFLAAKMNGWRMLAVCDCTGHGTAAALMTMVSHTLLQEAYYLLDDFWPHEILQKLDQGLIESLEGQEIYDGMDIGLLGYHPELGVRYAGAHIPLYYSDESGKVHQQKGAPFAIGYAIHNRKKTFRTHEIPSAGIKTLYLASDGFQDQFGKDNLRRFYSKNFKKLLVTHGQKPIQQQELVVYESFQSWKGNTRQIDDVMVVGVSLEGLAVDK